MNWLTGNSFFLILLLVCVGMHLFHGHGSHGKTNEVDEDDGHHDHLKHR